MSNRGSALQRLELVCSLSATQIRREEENRLQEWEGDVWLSPVERLSFAWNAEVYYLEELRSCLAFIRDNLIWFKYMSTATHCYYYPLSVEDVVPHPGSSCFLCIISQNYCHMQNCNLDQWHFTGSLKFFLPGHLGSVCVTVTSECLLTALILYDKSSSSFLEFGLLEHYECIYITHRKLCWQLQEVCRPLDAHQLMPESPLPTDIIESSKCSWLDWRSHIFIFFPFYFCLSF